MTFSQFAFFVFLVAPFAHSAPARYGSVPDSIRALVPSSVRLDSAEAADGKKELLAALNRCGLGVVKGSVGRQGEPLENRCGYRIELDEFFFRPTAQKTGLLPDPEWPYKEGETWYVANEGEIPEKFDIRDLMTNGKPDLRQQQCGDCWAWATHHGLELARAVHDLQVFDHSVQTVVSCSKHGSCGGGYMSAPTWLVNRGLPLESEFPYSGGHDSKCKFSSQEIAQGWTGAIYAAPNIGQSLRYSRYFKSRGFREGTKVQEIMAAILQSRAPAVVTVAAYSISGGGIYSSCSSINSDGNHMVTIVGWDTENQKRIAHVWNSWGKSHGVDGVSRIQWECGDGKLNRGLGVSARIIQYRVPCQPPQIQSMKASLSLQKGETLKLGSPMKEGVRCRWLPTAGLADPNSCETEAAPSVSTEYHLQASNSCGTASAMSVVRVLNAGGSNSKKLMTPYGEITED